MKNLKISSVIFLLLFLLANAVDRSKFRTCQDTGFCRRYRPKTTPQQLIDTFRLHRESVKEEEGHLSAQVIAPGTTSPPLFFDLFLLKTGVIRLRLSEQRPRWQPTDLLLQAGLEVTSFNKPSSPKDLPSDWQDKDGESFLALTYHYHPANTVSPETTSVENEGRRNTLIIQYAPLKVFLYHGDVLTMVVNDRQLMHFEQSTSGKVEDKPVDVLELSPEERHKGKEVVDYGEDGLAIYADGSREERQAHSVATQAATGESFNGHLDTMPKGHLSVGFDITFPVAQNVYGLPEHTTPLALPSTTVCTDCSSTTSPRYQEPYRLYNLDVFEYELDNTMALYGHIPLLYSLGEKKGSLLSNGVFLFNPSELFVDIADRPDGGKETHWMAESGLIDLFLLPGGSSIKQPIVQYASLTGGQALPPLFSLGYHQCRWNYRDEKDVIATNGMFEQLDYPYDVLWLDIEHTVGKRYFTWDKTLFPNPLEMQQNLSAVGRRMVTIVDPHIKRDSDFPVHSLALAQDLYIKDKHGAVYDGWCWPGSSSYLDFTSPKVRSFWAERFTLTNYPDSTLDLYTWNDMNEPSVFNGPEVSMPKDNVNLEGVEHREWHNLYGIYMQMATAAGLVHRSVVAHQQAPSLLDRLLLRSPSDSAIQESDAKKRSNTLRPFVLTRAFWAGSQRYGAMWTGDNTATWGHLAISLPMLLSINIAGLSFAGADVGGFFRDTEAELFVRWYQAGAFTPFFRGHAHHDTARKEPWVYGEPYTTINRQTALLRYSLLPYWYTVMQEAFEFGLPAMRPYFLEFPNHLAGHAVDDAFFVGSALYVKPVVEKGARELKVLFPVVRDPQNGRSYRWVELQTLRPVLGSDKGEKDAEVNYPVQLSTIPAFLRPGSILPRKLRLRRSSKLMHHDPFTLFITPGPGGAQGLLYLDDEVSYGYEEGQFAHRVFTYDSTSQVIQSRQYKDFVHPVGYDKQYKANPNYRPANTIERIVLLDQAVAPKQVQLFSANGELLRDLYFTWNLETGTLTVKKPDVLAVEDWEIRLLY